MSLVCGLPLLLFFRRSRSEPLRRERAAVQSDLVVTVVVHVCLSILDPLHRVLSSSSPRAFPFQLVMPSALVLWHTFSPSFCGKYTQVSAFNTNESRKFHPVALRFMYSLTCSPRVLCISRNVVTSHQPGSLKQALSDVSVGFHLDRCLPTLVYIGPAS